MLVFVSGAVSGKTSDARLTNIKRLEEGVEVVMAHGHVPICPGLMFKPFNNSYSWKWIMNHCLEILKKCDAIYFVEGWQGSIGANIEYLAADSQDLYFYYKEEDLPDFSGRIC